jgi:methyl-accepting chemotaxis protein
MPLIKKKVSLSFFSKNLIFSISSMVVTGLVMSIVSFFVLDNALTSTLTQQAKGVANLWSTTLPLQEVIDAKNNPDPNSDAQRQITRRLNAISENNPNVSLGYIFDPGVYQGNKTKWIALDKNLAKDGLKPGQLFDQPPAMVNAYNEINQTKSITTPPIYQDSVGTWMTVMVPIFDSNHNLIAVFGADADASLIKKQETSLLYILAISFAVFLIIGIIIQVFGIRKLLRPVKDLLAGMTKMSQGDLTQQLTVKSNDELGQLSQNFNTMVSSLRETIQQVSLTTEHLASSSEELAASADQSTKASEQVSTVMQELAAGTEEQASSATTTSHAIKEISSTAQHMKQLSQSVLEESSDATKLANSGDQSIQQVIHQMNSIYSTVNLSGESIKELGGHAQHIGAIVEAITNISSQTNLLALNAAIEAARAGEHGRGFAVVADEVRKLAEQSSASAQKINDYITTIQEGIYKVTETMEAGTKEVSQGITVVNKAGDTFSQILHSVNEVSDKVSESSGAIEKMSASIQEIVSSVERIAHVTNAAVDGVQNVSASTQQQLASMEEITTSAESLSRQAEELQQQISKFTIAETE